MNGKFNRTILVAPLDWGLGHAARCIPIIRYLSDIGCNVLIAAEGSQKKVLQIEFPFCEFIDLKGYRVKYSRNKRLLPVKIIQQLPKILKAIKYERKWLQVLTNKYHIHAIISDNRYGLYHKSITSVLIIHQLNIEAPRLLQKWIQAIHYRLINVFSACWVPDIKEGLGIAGKLSHPKVLPGIPTTYIGGLSRFEKKEELKQYDLLVIISGPEPQRTMLEQQLIKNIFALQKKVLFVRGLPEEEEEQLSSSENVLIKNHLPAADLNTAFEQSEFIISRSGYTTVMDILKLNKKSILIPTPGQTEQEYLAGYLHSRQWCLSFAQDGFDLSEALKKAGKFTYLPADVNMDQYKSVVKSFVEKL